MRVSIRTKLLMLCIVLVLVMTVGISATYYMLTKQDKQRESRQRIQIAFDIILNDFAKRITNYTASINKFLEENITLLWATYSYNRDDSEEGTIRFLFDHFHDVAEELRQFGRVALADRVMLYGGNKRLLVLYQRVGGEETRGGYLVSEREGDHYLPMDDPSVQAEITFRNNNLAIHAANRPLPDMPLPPGINAMCAEDIPDEIIIRLFREGQRLGIRIIAPIFRRAAKMGLLVGEVFYTQSMVEEYATLSKTDINVFADTQFSLGTLPQQTYLTEDELAQAASCQDILAHQRVAQILPISFKTQDYYQGRCVLKNEQIPIGAIAVSLSQEIEKREIGKILQVVFMIAAAGILICVALVSWIVVPTFTGPIITLSNAAIRMAQGDLEQQIDVSGTDELGMLARSFRYMRNEIQRKIAELQQLNAELDDRVERRTAEVVRQKYILDTFMETVPDRIYFKDRDGRITRANMAHARWMGLRNPSEELSKTDFDLFPRQDAQRRYNQEQQIILTGQPLIGGEEQRILPDGSEEWSLTTKMPLRNEHGDIIGTFGISRDITVLKQTEETLKHAKEVAEAANRAKTEFLANMNHELRTPLNVILGLAQIMTRNANIPDEERENLRIIFRSGEHLLTLINNVLDLSKIEAGQMILRENSVDILSLLDDLEEMFSLKAAQKQIALRIERAEDVPRFIRTDDTKLRQILMNLLNNAMKFTQEGAVTLRVTRVASPASEQPEPAPQLVFEVRDTGTGIAPEEMGDLFEAFTQTASGRQTQEGTGLGLTISQKCARLMGGDISAHSEVGRGSVFSVTVPVKILQAVELPPLSRFRRVIGVEPGQPQHRLLIVDDTPDNRRVLNKLLLPLGFNLREAANGQQACDLWHAFRPDFIFLDMRMPVMDGYETARKIRAAEKDAGKTVIIALTASSLEETRADALAAGCDDFLRKPVQEHDIFETLHTYLGVRYVYEDEPPRLFQGETQPFEQVLSPEAFATLPSDLLLTLRQAVDVTDPNMVNQLLPAIREYHRLLADTLAELVKQFRFDILQAVFEEHLSNMHKEERNDERTNSTY